MHSFRHSFKPQVSVHSYVDIMFSSAFVGDNDGIRYSVFVHGYLSNCTIKPSQNFAKDVLGFQEEDPTDSIKAWLGHGQDFVE